MTPQRFSKAWKILRRFFQALENSPEIFPIPGKLARAGALP
jgi:hypothetical protein